MIYCVEDDASIRDIEVYTLKVAGFEACGLKDSASLYEALNDCIPDLIILDIMLPGESGVDTLKKLKADSAYKDIPVIMATAKKNEIDKVESLDNGADDYLVKPFGMMEMVSRVKAVLRRCAKPKNEDEVYTAGNIELLVSEHKVIADGKVITLTYKEFELLKTFMKNPKVVFSREKLLDIVWGMDYYETHTVDVHIKTLRQKLGDSGKCIKTIRGVGYKLEG